MARGANGLVILLHWPHCHIHLLGCATIQRVSTNSAAETPFGGVWGSEAVGVCQPCQHRYVCRLRPKLDGKRLAEENTAWLEASHQD